MASVTTPRAVPVISRASFSVLSMMSVTAVRLAFTTFPAPWTTITTAFLAFSRAPFDMAVALPDEEPATVVTIASNPPIGLIGLRAG